MKASTVSSDGKRLLKVGAGGRVSFVLDDVLSCTDPNAPSRRNNEQQYAKRRMSSFPKINSVKPHNQRQRRRTGVSALHTGFGGDGKASPGTESLRRNFQSRGGLLALVFGAIHHLNHLLHQDQI